ncbi:MAG: DUF3083 family protein, partial [Colwellia sp.]
LKWLTNSETCILIGNGYMYLTDVFTLAAKRYNLNNGALIANGLVPIVRYSIHQHLAYNF